MTVAPHPHTGLQTVSWLFTGEIEHRDSAGNHAMVRPGELNLMTAGHGISHSEVSTPGTTTLHGAQLWVALPDADPGRRARASSTTRRPRSPAPAGRRGCSSARCSATTSPVVDRTPRCSAPSSCSTPGAAARASTSTPAFEHGVLVDTGVRRASTGPRPSQHELAYVPVGSRPPRLQAGRRAGAAAAPRRPAVRRADRDVVELRRPQPRGDRRLPRGVAGPDRRRAAYVDGRFGIPVGDTLPPIPAPPLPNARLSPRIPGHRRPSDFGANAPTAEVRAGQRRS